MFESVGRLSRFLSSSDFGQKRTIAYVFGTALLAVVIHYVLNIVRLIRKRMRDAEALKEFQGPKEHLIWGSVKEIFKLEEKVNFDIELVRKFPKAARTRMDPFYFQIRLHHPDTIKPVTNTAGDGLLISEGHKWARNRRLLTPAFHFDILKPYVTIFSQSAYTMTQKWRNMLKQKDQSFELFEHISLMTMDSLMKCIFGFKGDCQVQGFKHQYIQGVYDLANLTLERAEFFPFYNDAIFNMSWSGYKFRRANRIVHKYSQDVIAQRKQELADKKDESSTSKHISFMDMLLEARDEDGKGLTDAEIQAEVDTFMFGGYDTTASGISWCLYNLARHPEYQTKCRAEMNSVLGDREQFTWDDVHNLPFLTMCIKESLRLHPPVPRIARDLTKPLTLPDGRTIPAGTWIIISIIGCHYNPEVWENPEVYDPYRFTPENSKGRSSHAFIAFSAGPRNCMGQQFALYEMKASLGQIMRNFELFEEKDKPPKKDVKIILRSQEGLFIKAKPIER